MWWERIASKYFWLWSPPHCFHWHQRALCRPKYVSLARFLFPGLLPYERGVCRWICAVKVVREDEFELKCTQDSKLERRCRAIQRDRWDSISGSFACWRNRAITSNRRWRWRSQGQRVWIHPINFCKGFKKTSPFTRLALVSRRAWVAKALLWVGACLILGSVTKL